VDTSSTNDDTEGSSVDTDFCLEEVASLLRFVLNLKNQHIIGEYENWAQTNITLDMFLVSFATSISSRIPLLVDSYFPFVITIMRLIGHSWTCVMPLALVENDIKVLSGSWGWHSVG
jgi:hypothetical protein